MIIPVRASFSAASSLSRPLTASPIEITPKKEIAWKYEAKPKDG